MKNLQYFVKDFPKFWGVVTKMITKVTEKDEKIEAVV